MAGLGLQRSGKPSIAFILPFLVPLKSIAIRNLFKYIYLQLKYKKKLCH